MIGGVSPGQDRQGANLMSVLAVGARAGTQWFPVTKR